MKDSKDTQELLKTSCSLYNFSDFPLSKQSVCLNQTLEKKCLLSQFEWLYLIHLIFFKAAIAASPPVFMQMIADLMASGSMY